MAKRFEEEDRRENRKCYVVSKAVRPNAHYEGREVVLHFSYTSTIDDVSILVGGGPGRISTYNSLSYISRYLR